MTFDLERARCLRDFLQDDCAEVGDVWGEMIAEIERLRANEKSLSAVLDRQVQEQAARIKSLKKEIRRLKHESKVEVKFTNSYIKRLHDAEARIEELEDALVEGLTNFLHYRASCYDPARRCPYAKECDDCSTWDACGHVEKFRSEARQRLQADGKIGPGTRPSCWQITEERKAALNSILEYISYDSHDDIEICGHADILRAMLEGAE